MAPDHLSETFAALADPTRRAILARLARGEATVMELTEPSGISQPAISRHLKVLEQARLISRGRDAQRRPCRLEAAGLKEVASWVGGFQGFWRESYERLDDVLAEMARASADPGKTAPKRKERKHGR
jgi:DNA-binding transcriptional ArsR family regulator